jgi:hypothetical protein
MPIHESDPWREQYFRDVPCPPDLHIPTDDAAAFDLYPAHRWVYDKLLVAQSQGLPCGLNSVLPSRFPVFSKPVTNLRGMGIGSHLLRNRHDFQRYCKTGDFWMKLLTGTHVSTDWAVVRGEPQWCRHAKGIPGAGGTFDYWIVEARPRPALEDYCRDWIRRNLPGYTGMLNLETIDGYIIEVHLRFSDQWPDLYGRQWVDAVVHLYQHHEWVFPDIVASEQYSVALFGPHGIPYVHPSAAREAEYRSTPGVSSVQITFDSQRPLSEHAMPPGGFRLAIINCSALEVGLRLRSIIEHDFGLWAQGHFSRLAG